MDVFKFEHYKDYIAAFVTENADRRGYQTNLAKAAGCSRSFLSQVLAPHLSVNLTRDQALGLGHFWNLNDAEMNYFLLLVDYARAQTKPLKDFIMQQLETAKLESENLSKRVSKIRVTKPELEALYYSNWMMAAVHVLLTIPGFRTVATISDHLKVDIQQVDKILKTLAEMGLAEKKGNQFHSISTDLNLSETSPLSALNHANWRYRAIAQLQNRKRDSLHYSSVFSVSQNDLKKMKARLEEIVLDFRKMIIVSPEEKLVCLNFDCFEL